MKFGFAAGLLIALAAAHAAAGSVYRWVDDKGRVHYTDQPPPQGVKEWGEMKAKGSVVEVAKEPYETRLAAQKYPVVLFTSDCGPVCDQAVQHLVERGIPYASKRPDRNREDEAALKKLAGSMEVPVLTVGERVLKGYSKEQWGQALDMAGYPKFNPLTRKVGKEAKTLPPAPAPKP
jgi:glutaredoxin